jgi:hypothetical protein
MKAPSNSRPCRVKQDCAPSAREIERFELGAAGSKKPFSASELRSSRRAAARKQGAGRSIEELEVRRNDYLVEVRLWRQNIGARRKADWADWNAFFRENAHAARLHASGA